MNNATTIRIPLDLTNVQEADDGNTTYYGGSYVLNGVECRGFGNDRSDSYHSTIVEDVLKICLAEWPESQFSDEFQEDVNNAMHDIDGLGKIGAICVERSTDGSFKVWSE
jgi:hypothetical protein